MIFTARRYASAVYAVVVRLSVRLSVRPSVTSRHCTKMAKHRITETTPYDTPRNLVFWRQIPRRNSNGATPNESGKCRWSRFSTSISLYLRNCARYRHS